MYLEIPFSRLQWSLLVNGLLFTAFFLCCRPALNSVDEFYYLYTLAGGSGSEPTHLLHYIYTLHPILTWPIPLLFQLYAKLNWYSIFLLTLNLIACINLLYTFISLYRKGRATALFLLFFLFIESPLLMSFNYSNTSLVTAVSGLFAFLVHHIKQSENSRTTRRPYLFAILLILIAGLLRGHMLALYALLAGWMAVFLLPFRQLKLFALHLLLVAGILLLFIEGHRAYYQKQISNWNQEEQLRQALFYAANRPQTPRFNTDSLSAVKSSLIRSLFLYDTSFIKEDDILARNKRVVKKRGPEDAIMLRWFFINNKGYFLLIAAIALLLISTRNYKHLVRWLLISSLSIVLFVYLFVVLKITEAVFLALLMPALLSLALLLRNSKLTWKAPAFAGRSLVILCCVWMSLMLYQQNKLNVRNIEQNRAALKELASCPTSLFINTGGSFSYGDFYLWDTPAEYPIPNLVFSELIHTNGYQEILRRHQVKDLIQALPTRTDIYLIGDPLPLLKEYYSYHLGWETEIYKVPQFKYLNVYQIKQLISTNRISSN